MSKGHVYIYSDSLPRPQTTKWSQEANAPPPVDSKIISEDRKNTRKELAKTYYTN